MAAGNNIVGEVGLKVVPVDPNAQFQAGVDQLIKRLEKQAQFQVKASGLEQVEQQANSAGQAFAGAAIQAAGLTAAVYGIKAAVEGAIGKLSGLFDQLAQAKAGFTSILKSEAAGGQLLSDIREFARVSPFVTQELVNYSQQLLGVGTAAEEIIPLLKSTGDIISSVGGDTTNLGRVLFTLTQIKSIGALKGQDTMQLQNSLIPITKYLSEYLHKSSAEIIKLREDGKITADVVFAALNQQGDKVKGAMDKATRNIAGARAILSDTIIQLFQDQPVLNKIFKETFESIIKLSNAIGEEDFQQAFSQFFDGVEKVYEGLKPLLTALSTLVSEGVLSGMQVLGTILGTFGTVLSAIPKEGIEAFARILLALTTLKAPLLLIGYITSIKTMASAIIPATTNLAKLGGAAAASAGQINTSATALDRHSRAALANARATQAAQYGGSVPGSVAREAKGGVGGFLGRNASNAILGGSVAATVGGGILSQSDNTTAKTAGGFLQGAGIGASIGMLAGPEGAAVGAVIGGALGAITSFMAQSEAKAKAHIVEMQKLGDEAAAAFVTASGKKFGEGLSNEEFTAGKAEIRRLELKIADAQTRLNATTFSGISNKDDSPRGQAARQRAQGRQESTLTGDARSSLQDELTQDLKTLAEFAPQIAAEYDPIIAANAVLVEGLDKSQAAYQLFATKVNTGGQARGRGGGTSELRRAATDVADISAGLEKYGFTLDDIKTSEGIEKVLAFIRAVDGLTSAQALGVIAAKKYNDGLAAAKIVEAALFDDPQKKIESEIELINVQAQADAAQYNITTKTAALNAELMASKSAELVASQKRNEYQLRGYDLATIDYAARVAGEKELLRLETLRRSGASGRDRDGVRKDAAPNDFTNPNFEYELSVMVGEREKREAEEKLAKEAAEKAAADALAFADKVKSSTSSLVDQLEGAAEAIADAAMTWVGSIKERTQYEASISAGRAISNTQKQIKDLTELAAGLAELRARGLSDEAIKSLGIDNVSDVKQVRKLLKANPNDLTTLSSSVSELNKKATDIATAEEDKRTQKNIAEGIVAAAETLGADFSKTDAAALAATFNFDTSSNPEEIAAAIISILSGGKISRG